MSLLRHSLLIESTKRSAKAFKFGLRAGNRTGSTTRQAQVMIGSKTDSLDGGSVNEMRAGAWDTEFGLGNHNLPIQASFEARRMD